jgi:hypothetical protein
VKAEEGRHRLVPVHVERCAVPRLLRPLLRVEPFDVDEAEATGGVAFVSATRTGGGATDRKIDLARVGLGWARPAAVTSGSTAS